MACGRLYLRPARFSRTRRCRRSFASSRSIEVNNVADVSTLFRELAGDTVYTTASSASTYAVHVNSVIVSTTHPNAYHTPPVASPTVPCPWSWTDQFLLSAMRASAQWILTSGSNVRQEQGYNCHVADTPRWQCAQTLMDWRRSVLVNTNINRRAFPALCVLTNDTTSAFVARAVTAAIPPAQFTQHTPSPPAAHLKFFTRASSKDALLASLMMWHERNPGRLASLSCTKTGGPQEQCTREWTELFSTLPKQLTDTASPPVHVDVAHSRAGGAVDTLTHLRRLARGLIAVELGPTASQPLYSGRATDCPVDAVVLGKYVKSNSEAVMGPVATLQPLHLQDAGWRLCHESRSYVGVPRLEWSSVVYTHTNK